MAKRSLKGQAAAWLHQLEAPSTGKPGPGTGEPGAQRRWQLDSLRLAEQVLQPLGDASRKAPWGRGVRSQAGLRAFCSTLWAEVWRRL